MTIPTRIWSVILIVNACLATGTKFATNTYLTANDRLYLKKIFDSGIKANDLPTVYSAVSGYRYLEEAIPKETDICGVIKKFSGNSSLTVDDLHYLACTWEILDGCRLETFPLNDISKILKTFVERENSTVLDLYHALSALQSLKQTIPDTTISRLSRRMQSLLKTEDNLLNIAHIFHIAADLGSESAYALNHVEDAIFHADELEGQFLQFEGGLSVTSHLLNGMIRLSSNLNKKLPLTTKQIVNLGNYLLSRKFVQDPKSALDLVSSMKLLATSRFHKPICIMASQNHATISAEQPMIRVRICDLLGHPVPAVSRVTLDSAKKLEDDIMIMTGQELHPDPDDPTLYHLDFSSASTKPGFYQIEISTNVAANTAIVKVLVDVEVGILEIGIADADQTTNPKMSRIMYPAQLAGEIEADSHQKLIVRFSVVEKSTREAMKIQQSFIRLSTISERKIDHEMIFVAERDASNFYKIDMPVSMIAENFNHQSGSYKVDLIIGDAFLSESIEWTIASVILKFPERPKSSFPPMSNEHQEHHYAAKPEIKHMFREPVTRPSTVISNFFTGLCFAPILVLIFSWWRLGVNASHFSLSPTTVIFHLGIGAIFSLFGIFWIELDMFIALRCLLGLGLMTSLSGNSVLARTAINRKAACRAATH